MDISLPNPKWVRKFKSCVEEYFEGISRKERCQSEESSTSMALLDHQSIPVANVTGSLTAKSWLTFMRG